MSTAAAVTTTPAPVTPQPTPFADHLARFKAHETCPTILPLLDRRALRLLAAWSPDLVTTPSHLSTPSAVSTPSDASAPFAPSSVPGLRSAPSAIATPSAASTPSDASELSDASDPSVPGLPSALWTHLWTHTHVDLDQLADLTALDPTSLKTALRQLKAHRLIYPDGTLNTHVKDLLDARTHRLTAFARRRRLLANRANALKSTGPRTDDGKTISALNALKHALTAEAPIVMSENRHDYDAFHHALHFEYDPQGPTETLLVDQLVKIAWRLQRVHMAEARLCLRLCKIDHERARREVPRPYQAPAPIMAPDAHPGHILLRACEENLLPKIDRHHTTLHRAFLRTLHELLDIQSARHNAPQEKDLQQLGFVLKNEIPTPHTHPDTPAAAAPTPSAPSDPSDASSVPAPSTPSTPSAPSAPSAFCPPPSAFAVPSAFTPPVPAPPTPAGSAPAHPPPPCTHR